jgi:hypothetical protein
MTVIVIFHSQIRGKSLSEDIVSYLDPDGGCLENSLRTRTNGANIRCGVDTKTHRMSAATFWL